MKVLTEQEKNVVASVLLDSAFAKSLQDSPQDPRRWALDYLYDSKLRKDFETALGLTTA